MPQPEHLIFPRGVRFPRSDELPAGSPGDAEERLAEVAANPLTTGYVVKAITGQGYTAVIEANVHAPKLWSVFSALVSALLPTAAAPIVGVGGEEPILGPYTTRDAAVAVLEPYRDSLTNDGFLEFGCIFQRGGKTEEVFVRAAKYLRVWTNTPERAIKTLEDHGIPLQPGLRFIDEYPRVSEALPYGGETSGWYPVCEELRTKFAELPARPESPQDA